MIDRNTSEFVQSFPFGHGGLVEPLPYIVEGMSPHDVARLNGWLNGCPVVENLTDPNNDSPGRGPEAMAERYADVNKSFYEIVSAVNAVNPDLATSLVSSVPRVVSEEPGVYETESVPDSFHEEMAPLGTLWGYALPRLKNAFDAKKEGSVYLIIAAAEESHSPNELLARFTGMVIRNSSLTAVDVLSKVLPKGWYEEHKADIMLENFKKQLEQTEPDLYEDYKMLSDTAKVDNKIV